MDLYLDNRRALVTAASRGLGFACAKALLNEGADVVICSRSQKNLDDAVGRLEAETHRRPHAVTADVSVAADRERLVEEAGKLLNGSIEIMVTNAGGPPPGPFEAHSLEDWENACRLTLLSTVDLCRRVIGTMRENGFGRIVQIVSIAGQEHVDNLILSNALRPGVLGFGRVLSREAAADNVFVNSICPGMFLTDRMKELALSRSEKAGISADDFIKEATADIPAGRMGNPDEVGDLAAFLASPRNGYIAGSSVVIDGARIRKLF